MFKLFMVGGCVRDKLLGVPSKDIDFTVVHIGTASGAFEDDPERCFRLMVEWLQERHGVKMWLETPEHVTARGHFPKDHPRFPGVDADFVLARKEGPHSDGRRPDWVTVGTLQDDLARRDFTVNAIAETINPDLGEPRFVDLFGGRQDLEHKILRFVGDPMDRINEDGLRVMRAFRFEITKGLKMHADTFAACMSLGAARALSIVSEERREQELSRMLHRHTPETIALLADVPWHTTAAIFNGRVRFTATLKS